MDFVEVCGVCVVGFNLKSMVFVVDVVVCCVKIIVSMCYIGWLKFVVFISVGMLFMWCCGDFGIRLGIVWFYGFYWWFGKIYLFRVSCFVF